MPLHYFLTSVTIISMWNNGDSQKYESSVKTAALSQSGSSSVTKTLHARVGVPMVMQDLPPPPPTSGDGIVASSYERFGDADVPPSPPADAFFKFMVTTRLVSDVAPHALANILLEYLNDRGACLTKVNHAKFSIKAKVTSLYLRPYREPQSINCGEALDCGFECLLKIRIYLQGGPRECAVEFKRCSGDVLLFMKLWKGFWQHLAHCMPMVEPRRYCTPPPGG